MKQRDLLRFVGSVLSVRSVLIFLLLTGNAHANPYLPKPGEAPIKARVGTCSITGTIIHLSTAMDHGIFDKYGLRMEHIAFRGSGVTLAALGADEIQFLTCAASATLPGIATGAEAKYIGSQLVGLPWVMLGRKEIRTHEAGTQTRRKAADIVDNRFAEDLAKSGFLTELWGKELPK